MTATRTLYRKASVSPAEATASLFKRFPTMDLVSFVKKEATAEEAAAARAKEGDSVYAATIRVAEFPPEGGEESSEEAPEPKEEKSEAPEPSSDKDPDGDGDDDSSSEGDSDHDFAGKDEGGPEGVKPKKLSPEEQIVHLLQQILDALQGGGHDPMAGPDGPGGGLDLPDVGAPDKGDIPGAGPAGPGKAPLPPPVHEKSPIGVGAFAHVTGAEVSMVREDANEVNNAKIIAEAARYAPKHKVAKIQRTGLAEVEGELLDLAEARLALVTLVSK